MSTNTTIPKFRLNTGATDPLVGYEIVARLLDQQDTVLEELDALNERIETTIKEITVARQAELIALGEIDSAADEAADSISKAA